MEQPGREMISLDEALNRVLGTLDVGGREQVLVDLDQSLGRILAEDILAAEDFPAQDNSAMDGFAVKAGDLVGRDSLTLVGQSLAGQPFDGQLEAGQCTRVMTGGLIPKGADAVVPVENTSGYEPAKGGAVSFDGKPLVGDNIRPRGGVIRAGESLLAVGTKIGRTHV